jgi:hypothetical protein
MKTILTWDPHDASTVAQFKAVLGSGYFNHGGILRVGLTEVHVGEQVEVTIEPLPKAPDGDSLMVHVPDATRGALITALATMPDEAFSWLVLAMQSSAMTHGATAQIWPDGMGGFQSASRESVAAARTAATEWINQGR